MFGARLSSRMRRLIFFISMVCLLAASFPISRPQAFAPTSAEIAVNHKQANPGPLLSNRARIASAGILLLPGAASEHAQEGKGSILPQGSSLNKSIQDATDPSKVLLFNSSTGAFQFSECDLTPSPFFAATGTVTTVNSIINLQYNTGGNKVTAQINSGSLTGTATVTLAVSQGVFQTYRLQDSNTSK
ncbi:MAG: hypothetical protein ACREDR_16160, partial [Blastocatellia bacterium]